MDETTLAGSRSAADRAMRGYISVSRTVIVAVSCLVLAFMVGVNGLEIVSRGVFRTSFSWVQELSVLAAMWVYFFAYALIAKNDEYIRADFLVRMMSATSKNRLEIATRLVSILFHAVVAIFAVQTYRILGLFTTSVLAWPESLFVVPIMLGAFDIVITECIYLYRQIAGYAPLAPSPLQEQPE